MTTVDTDERRPRRGAELGLLVLALAIGIGAYAVVGLQLTDALPEHFYLVGGAIAAFGLTAHVLLRVLAPYADQVMLPVVIALNGIGLAMIYRLDLGSQVTGGDQNLAPGQLQFTAISMVVAFVVIWLVRDHRLLRRYTYTAMVVGIVLVALPLVPGLGVNIHGAEIWINLFGYSLQPAEFAKIAFAIFFAGYLVTNRDTLALAGPKILGLQLPRLRDLGPIIIVWLVSLAILVFERDLGTSLLFFGLFVAMLYIATERVSWVVIGLLLFAVGAVAATVMFGHVEARVEVWLHPFDAEVYGRDPGGSGQLVGGLFGLANGGLFGTGWGAGYPRLVPFAQSDFIYASLGEELGLTGLLAILLAYLILVERGLRTAVAVRDGFGKLLAGGLAFVMAWQLFVVVGGITRIIPLTGLTMPFIAQGGSSLLANWIVVALLLRISDNARRPSSLPVRGQVAPGGVRAHEPVAVPGGGAVHAGAMPDDAPTAVGGRVGSVDGGGTDTGHGHATDQPTEVVARPSDDDQPGGAR
ncbi:FtsW/RodA/SpoVE family cell cycle protein [Cellulosimicrobium arenosum]|uniref:FtsW/RodA/SpoVE family cell cycle protein n=1 Tax=Cellulosimicrobium arenosum TaxID=2708133 RepID=A0A927J1P6_9MICO|nr:FtsW/RodA/SpoVE family cell cycle protein [Cellulosimicrobium arenosum]MBD8080005.1 FtsW/RodA/SpoVE family cell cycle protein [Cellulosimicrobium arenosum]